MIACLDLRNLTLKKENQIVAIKVRKMILQKYYTIITLLANNNIIEKVERRDFLLHIAEKKV